MLEGIVTDHGTTFDYFDKVPVNMFSLTLVGTLCNGIRAIVFVVVAHELPMCTTMVPWFL